MKFYITGETYRKLKNVFTNLNTFYIIDVDTLIKDSGLNFDVYYSYTIRKYKAIIAKITIDFIIILFEDRELLLNLQKIYRKIKIKNGVVTLSIRRK